MTFKKGEIRYKFKLFCCCLDGGSGGTAEARGPMGSDGGAGPVPAVRGAQPHQPRARDRGARALRRLAAHHHTGRNSLFNVNDLRQNNLE